MPDLRLRLTHKYRDAYDDLDQWETIGSYQIVMTSPTVHIDQSIPEDPTEQSLLLKYKTDEDITDRELRSAVRNDFERSPCTHDYDCCGCRHSYVSKYTKLNHEYILITIGTSRNY